MSIHTAMHLTGVERKKDDFYATPAEVTRALLSVEGDRIRRLSTVWEPAAGAGHMVDALRDEGLDVIASDLIDRGLEGCAIRSFYDFNRHTRPARCLVTNPPFKECNSRGGYRWLKHALTLGLDYMALLLPSQWPYARGLRPFFDTWPPATEYKLAWRIDWGKGKSSPANHSWFVWSGRDLRRRSWSVKTIYRDEVEKGRRFYLEVSR